LVEVWVDSAKDCVPPTLRALASLKDFLVSVPSIIAGDFNQTVTLDKGRIAGHRFADVLVLLNSLGVRSAWHTFTGEAQGQESSATLYWRWNAQAKYHIDFIFGSKDLQVESATLGRFDQYVRAEISDHMPLSVEFYENP
jgi:endonuclease/exonuclease/phosphatase family metal-dependent hydrolase